MGWEEWVDLDLWTCDLKINRDHLLIEGKPCIKFGINQVKGSEDIKRTTQWSEKSGLTLTFEHVTWKSIGIIYSFRATPAPSLVLIKWRGQKILIGQDLVYRPTDRPTYRPTDRPTVAKQYAPFFKGSIKISRDALPWSSLSIDNIRFGDSYYCYRSKDSSIPLLYHTSIFGYCLS